MSEQPQFDASFERHHETSQARIMKMGGLVERAIADVAQSLQTRDDELAEQVCRRDAAIDLLEETITQEVTLIIARHAPQSHDLRPLLAMIRISASLQRIGDYAGNIARRTAVLSDMTPVNGASAALRRMAREVQAMLKDVLDAYVQRDADLARAVISRDQDVDRMYNTIFRELLTFMMEDPRNITACMHLHFIARNIERMGDLVTSIAEQVVLSVSGELPQDPRPKDDRTASDPVISRQVQA